MGVSGGSISNMFLTLHNKPIHQAVATSAGLGIPITIAGAIGFMLAGLPQQSLMPPLSIGFVSLIGFAVMAPVSSFTATYGARLAHALPKRKLEDCVRDISAGDCRDDLPRAFCSRGSRASQVCRRALPSPAAG